MILYRDIKMSTIVENSTMNNSLSLQLKSLEKYMFSSKNMMKYNNCINELEKCNEEVIMKPIVVAVTKPIIVEKPIVVAVTKPIIVEEHIVEKPIVVAVTKPINNESFIPFQKDKLFWCFYTLLKGFSEYEMHRTGFYAVEKAFKISTVEKMRAMKQEIKDVKLKINDVEDELVNKEQITLKGLQVLCIVYKVSITYIYGKKYCEFLYNDADADANLTGIIKQTERKEHALIYEDSIDISNIKKTHWFIENVQKPLKTPASYTLKDLQDICEKLEVPLKHEIGKSKTKKDLYEDILTKL